MRILCVALFRSSIACAGLGGLLVGCNGAATVPAAQGSAFSQATGRLPTWTTSWTTSQAKNAKSLLYISQQSNQVTAYAWPNPTTPVAALVNFIDTPSGECADNSGDVYITYPLQGNIVEYHSGSLNAKRTIPDSGEEPYACSIDTKTGDLAVSNFGSSNGGAGVSIYARAAGTPKVYVDGNMANVYYLGYDGKGTIWLDGCVGVKPCGFRYASLDPKTGKFQTVDALKGATLVAPAGIQYDGKHIAVGDSSDSIVYQTNGFKAVGRTQLGDASLITQFAIVDNELVSPDLGTGTVEIYKYPSGGNPIRTVVKDISGPVGAAITNSGS